MIFGHNISKMINPDSLTIEIFCNQVNPNYLDVIAKLYASESWVGTVYF